MQGHAAGRGVGSAAVVRTLLVQPRPFIASRAVTNTWSGGGHMASPLPYGIGQGNGYQGAGHFARRRVNITGSIASGGDTRWALEGSLGLIQVELNETTNQVSMGLFRGPSPFMELDHEEQQAVSALVDELYNWCSFAMMTIGDDFLF
ncbi:unnamed protein product [Discosporangium mesarthrocarpum]